MTDSKELVQIVNESGLEKSKADVLLASFEDYFKLAAEWESKAKVLVVTDASQTAEMKMAREGRLFLKEKRVALEKTRKVLKEQSLREGKAIDGIANVLKALIVPIEQYLDEQEHFVENLEAMKQEAIRLEIEAKMKAEEDTIRLWLATEQEQIRLDNARLREEAEAKEKLMKAEQEKAEADKRKIRAEAEAKAEAAKKKARAQIEAERQEKARLQKQLDEQIECPFCHKKFNLQKKRTEERKGN